MGAAAVHGRPRSSFQGDSGAGAALLFFDQTFVPSKLYDIYPLAVAGVICGDNAGCADNLLRLSEERTRELIKTKKGLAHDPGTGKPMKDRVLVPASKKRSWIKLCEGSLKFVAGK